MDFFMEVAKMRAPACCWARLVRQFDPTERQVHVAAHPLPDVRLVADRPGRVQQRHAHDHRGDGRVARGIPSRCTPTRSTKAPRAADRLLRADRPQHQLLLQQESGTTRVIDPWGGSYYVERLTHDLAVRRGAHIDEVEAAGGMARPSTPGPSKCASRRRRPAPGPDRLRPAGPDRVNRYRPENDPRQLGAQGGQHGGPRELTVGPSWNGCAPGGIRRRSSRRCRRRSATRRSPNHSTTAWTRTCSSWPSTPPGAGDGRRDLRGRREGVRPPRRPSVRSLVSTPRRRVRGHAIDDARGSPTASRPSTRAPTPDPGRQDGPGRPRPGQKVIATAFADLGFDVDVGPVRHPRRSRPSGDRGRCPLCGVSSLAAGHLTLVPALRKALDELGRSDILIVVGGVIPPDDFDALRAAGPPRSSRPGR